MKRMIQGMLLSASALAFVAAPATVTPVFAQDTAATPAAGQCNAEERDKLYNERFYPNYSLTKATPEQQATAYEAAKEYVAKFPSCENQPQIDFINKWIPKYEQLVKDRKTAEIAKRFNEGVKNNNGADVFGAGKELLAINAENIPVMLYMADQGFIQASKNVDTFNNDAVAITKTAIEKINSGKAPEGNNWSPFKSKEDALAWLNYELGYIYSFRLKDTKSAVPYFYQATKITGSPEIAAAHLPYQVIGDWYLDQFNKAVAEYNTKKDDTTLDEAKKNELDGMWKAYADRAIEAYGRAYAKAKANTKTSPETLKGINETLTSVYKVRNKNEATGLDAYVASLNSKPMTDPTTPVTPVVEATPATTTTSTTPPSGATSTTTATDSAKSTTAAAAKAPAETKPAVKKGKNR